MALPTPEEVVHPHNTTMSALAAKILAKRDVLERIATSDMNEFARNYKGGRIIVHTKVHDAIRAVIDYQDIPKGYTEALQELILQTFRSIVAENGAWQVHLSLSKQWYEFTPAEETEDD